MNNYCGTCQNYVENDPCDVCEGTENNHVYYVPDFRKRKNSPMKHGAGEHKTDDFIRRAEAINEMHNILVSPIESDDEFNIGVRRCMSSVNNIPAADVVEVDVKDLRVKKAIQTLCEFYSTAKKSDYVQKPLAWALYQTWKSFDKMGGGVDK